MLLNNDSSGWINGTIGKIVDIEEGDEEDIVSVELEMGKLSQ